MKHTQVRLHTCMPDAIGNVDTQPGNNWQSFGSTSTPIETVWRAHMHQTQESSSPHCSASSHASNVLIRTANTASTAGARKTSAALVTSSGATSSSTHPSA